MKTLSEFLKEYHSLPLGDIYKKTINGKAYYYHQYFLNGKRYSEIIKKEKLLDLRKQIARRKEVEKEIKDIKSKQKNLSLSKHANELTGYVMSGNNIVASFQKGVLVNINDSLAPLVIKRTHSIEEFLKLRVIDMSRTNARILKRILNIHVDDDYKSALYSYALSINDNYWFKPKHSKIIYQDIIFTDNSYFDASLKGDTTYSIFKNQLTPEITTTGSFEKGWKCIDGVWWLYKSGNEKQVFSELFCYQFARLMGLETAIYEYDEGYIRSKNFADKYNFEPLAALLGDDDSYQSAFQTLFGINHNIAQDYLKLMFFDAVVNNVDRHNENLGVMRDRNSGKIISLAPNFDNNLALYSHSDILASPQKDGLIKLFVTFLKSNKKAMELFKNISFVNLNKEDIMGLFNNIPIKINNPSSLADSILLRYDYLKSMF